MAEEADMPAAKRARLKFSYTIEILVGPEKTSFTTHTKILTERSTFFKAACSQRWAKSGESSRPVELPEDSAYIFDVYLNCVYRNAVEIRGLERAVDDEDKERYRNSRKTSRLAKLYVVADKMGDIITSNMIVDEIIRNSDELQQIPNGNATRIVVMNTPKSSPCRQLFIDYYVHEGDLDAARSLFADDGIPRDFLGEIFEEGLRLKIGNRSRLIKDVYQLDYTSKNKCRYHQHDVAHPRCGESCVWEKPA